MAWEDDDEREYSHEEIEKTPIYIKATEIMELVAGIHALVSQEGDYDSTVSKSIEREMTIHIMQDMLESSLIIPVKLGASYGPGLYSIKMEAATLIRMHAMRVRVNINGLRMGGYEESEYFDILRKTVDEFQILFAEWVKTFDPWDYIIDRWGLFNPPGVNYDDHDPDDDIPL